MRLFIKSGFCLLLLSVGVNFTSFAQKQKLIDSLHGAIYTRTNDDTSKVSLLAALARQYHSVNTDSESYYSHKAYDLSQKLHYTKGSVFALQALGNVAFIQSDLEHALSYYRQALPLCESNGWHYDAAVLLNDIANALYRQSKFNEALEHYDSAIAHARKGNNLPILGKAQSNIGNIFYSMGNYTNALKNYLAGLEIQEKLDKKPAMASDISNIANVYFRLFQYDKAIEYNTRGIALSRQTGNKTDLIANLTTFALIYDAEQKYDSSLIQLNEALTLAKETKDVFTENIVNSNIAECYLKKGEYDKALPIYLNSIPVSEKLGDAEGIAIAKSGAGQTLLKQGKNKEAIPYLTDALAILQQLGIKEQILPVSKALADVYEQTGDYKQSLHYFKINHSTRDSINRSKSKQEAQQLVFNYELKKKEEMIKLMHENDDIMEAKVRFKNLLIFSFVLGMCVAVIAAYLFFSNIRKLKKSREILTAQKKEIECQAKKLQELNDFKDNTFNVLSHDLRSPVNALTSAMMLLDDKLITPDEFAMYRHELNSKLQSVNLLLENMLYWARSQMKGESTLSITKLDVRNKALRVIAVLKDAAIQKNIQLTYDIAEHIHVMADKNQLDIILRNLVSNAIKFTNQGGQVIISAKEDGNKTHISITDTGVGMTEEQINKLFLANMHTSTQGTSGERGTGLGLQLSNKFAKNNNGSITIKSTLGKGTIFTVTLPSA